MRPEEVVTRVFGLDGRIVDDSTTNADVAEWDSVGHMNLILELEATYDVSISPDEALKMTSIGSIKRLLEEQGVRW